MLQSVPISENLAPREEKGAKSNLTGILQVPPAVEITAELEDELSVILHQPGPEGATVDAAHVNLSRSRLVSVQTRPGDAAINTAGSLAGSSSAAQPKQAAKEAACHKLSEAVNELNRADSNSCPRLLQQLGTEMKQLNARVKTDPRTVPVLSIDPTWEE